MVHEHKIRLVVQQYIPENVGPQPPQICGGNLQSDGVPVAVDYLFDGRQLEVVHARAKPEKRRCRRVRQQEDTAVLSLGNERPPDQTVASEMTKPQAILRVNRDTI